MTFAASHPFWTAPRRPMLTNGPYRALPIRLGGQFLSFGNPFMGQAPPAPAAPAIPPSSNRLDALATSTLMNRIMASAPLVQMQTALTNEQAAEAQNPARGFFPPGTNFGGGGGGYFQEQAYATPSTIESEILYYKPNFPAVSTADQATLAGIAANPSPDELADLAIIDGFFPDTSTQASTRSGYAPDFTQQICAGLAKNEPVNIVPSGANQGQGNNPWVYQFHPTTAQLALAWLLPVPIQQPQTGGQGNYWARPAVTPTTASAADLSTLKNNPFYCGSSTGFSYDNTHFGIDASQPWGTIKQQVKNAIVVGTTIASYPFPPPIDQYQSYFWGFAGGDIQKIIATPTTLDPDTIKFWITLFVIANYNAMVEKLKADLKHKEKKEKREEMMRMIGMAVAAIVAAIILPAAIAAIVSLVKTAITTYTTIEDQKKAAKAASDTAKLFADDAPAFSAEAQNAANILDVESAMEQANSTPSPDMQAAIAEVKANTPSKVSPLVPIGGLAAAGLAAFFIFK